MDALAVVIVALMWGTLAAALSYRATDRVLRWLKRP